MKIRRREMISLFDDSVCTALGRRPAPWEIERAMRLHHRFVLTEAAQDRGTPFRKSINGFVWFWRGRTYRCDPSRNTRFGYGTVVRCYYIWREGGRTPIALLNHYTRRKPSVPLAELTGFVAFAAGGVFARMKQAHAEYCAARGAAPGSGKAEPLSYGQLQYFFNGKRFSLLQTKVRQAIRAQRKLAALESEFSSAIARRHAGGPR